MTDTDLRMATSLSALGHEARLHLYRFILRAGDEGVNVGAISRHLDLPASTLAHHLTALVGAGLIIQEKRGRETINRADFAAMDDLVSYLTEECCLGVDAYAPKTG